MEEILKDEKKEELNPVSPQEAETNMPPEDAGQSTEIEETKSKKKHKKISEKDYERLNQEVEDLKDKYLRLYSEFENFRRRTAKEKLDLSKTANEDLMFAIIPVLDDFERASRFLDESNSDIKAIKDGIALIFNKLRFVTEQKGLKLMTVEKGAQFNPELHEAIAQVPVEDDNLKGKLLEVVEKGYYLNDKVLRFAKVITGS